MDKKKSEKLSPIVKNIYRKTIKAVKNTAKLVAITGLVFSASASTISVAREIYEEINTKNQIIDLDFGFGSFVLANRDARSAIQIYKDAINTALNVEGLESVYKSENMTVEEKKAFIEKFAIAVAESAGIRIEKVVFVDEKVIDDAQGVYIGFNKGIIAFSLNRIYLSNQMLKGGHIANALETTFHEISHGIESINIQTNKNVDNMNSRAHNGKLNYANYVNYKNKIYYSNFHEITAFSMANKFRTELGEKFGADKNLSYFTTYDTLNNILSEIIKNDLYSNQKEENYYKNLSVLDILNIGIENNYKNAGVDYDQQEVNYSYTYEVINYGIPNYMLNSSFRDFETGILQYRNLNLQQEVITLQQNIADFSAGNYGNLMIDLYEDQRMSEEDYISMAEQILARQMMKIVSIVRYGEENYTQEDVNMALQIINSNINLLKDSTIQHFALDNLQDLDYSILGIKNTVINDLIEEDDLSF